MTKGELEERAGILAKRKVEFLQKLYPNKEEYKTKEYCDILFYEYVGQVVFSEKLFEKAREKRGEKCIV